jgi:polysaccharide pyruvyl transferase WcaK-like protein
MMSLQKRVRRKVKKTVNAATTASGLPFRIDRAVFRRAAATPANASGERWHVLIAPPGGGNIGDQAMVEAYLENTTGPVRIVVRGIGDIRIPVEQAGRATFTALPGLIYGDGRAHLTAVAAFARLLAGARSLTVVGADIMDGAYDVRASARRADVTTLASSIGVDSRVLGFSWNGRARTGARRALARAGRAGTRLLVRDPRSVDRARADGLTNVAEVADAVFSARTTSATAVDEFLGGDPGAYAVLNASGLVGRSMDQVSEYEEIVRSLLDRGLIVVLLPHVVRASADDSAACRAVAERVDDPRVVLITRVLDPAEVRGLVAGAALVLTGRMHLAIQALWNSVPAITLSTQGKVEGLMQLFGTATLCVEPGPGLAKRILPVAADLLARPEHHRRTIAGRLPAIVTLSHQNFVAL